MRSSRKWSLCTCVCDRQFSLQNFQSNAVYFIKIRQEMDAHRDALKNRCRLCCTQCNVHGPYSVSSSKDIIKVALDIDIEQDDSHIHPPSLCGSCFQKLRRWKKGHCKKAKAVPLNIPIHNFDPHEDGCEICNLPEEDIITMVTRMASEFLNFFVQKRSNRIYLVELDDDGNSRKAVTIKEDGSWCVRVYGRIVSRDVPQLHETPDILSSSGDIKGLLGCCELLNICQGNEHHMSDESLAGKPVYRHHLQQDNSTIRHRSCPLLTESAVRCGPCSIYRSTLAASAKSGSSHPQHTPYRYLPREEIAERLRKSKGTIKTMKRRINNLEREIENMVKQEGHELPPDQTQSFGEILNDNDIDNFFQSLPEGSPQRILFEQQKLQSISSPTRMRWHPALLRLCIAIHSKSSSAYNLLRSSGFLKLPHTNTLRNYTHFTDSSPGLNKDLLRLLLNEHRIDEQPQYKRNVCLLMDEMKIKTGLVFNSSGRLVGFSDVGEINNELRQFEDSLQDKRPKLATHVFVLMVRGLCCNMKAPFGYFPCESLKCDEIYLCALEGIRMLEYMGLRVRAITSDGASTNRKFYDMCVSVAGDHWTINPFDKSRKIYFISDPPHLLKTVRNNFANSGSHTKTRNLMYRGKQISWVHILKAYEWDIAQGSGLRKLYKITTDHLHLTPTSRMRVSLAAQVLSSTMANALRSQGLSETESTISFIERMDLFFDCLNVSNTLSGKLKRKISLEPYRDLTDWRFTFLEEDFLSFLDEWENESMLVKGLSRTERAKLHLSKPTMDGLRMTVKSFVALAKELLVEDGVEYFLSEKLSQDPLEEHFGKQRGMGGSHENPDARQFGSNMQVLQVAGSCVSVSRKANTQRQSGRSPMKSQPLPKRQKKN